MSSTGTQLCRGLLAVLVTLSLLMANPAEAAAPKPGARCSTLNEIDIARGKVYTCVRKGKKLVWNSGRVIPKPIPTTSAAPRPTPTVALPLSPPDPVQLTFSNVFEKRQFVQSNAWHAANRASKMGAPKLGAIEVLTGPNSKPYYEDFTTAVAKLSRLLRNFEEPKEVLVIRYSAKDLAWASAALRAKLSEEDFRVMQQRQGQDPAAFNCPGRQGDCTGAYQQTPHSGLAVLMMGIPNQIDSRSSRDNFTSGSVEVHEYFHAVQRLPMLAGQKSRSVEWPGAWFREGSATWIQYAAIYAESFVDYNAAMREVSKCRKSQSSTEVDSADLGEMLTSKDHEAVPSGWDKWAQYCLGAQVVEVLVAIGGIEVVMSIYEAAGGGDSWDQAFERIFGTKWTEAVPVLASTVAALANGS